MRRNMSKVISVVLTMSLALSMCACSAKSSADTENTTAEAETEIETEEETEEETVDASGNDPSGNDVYDNDVSGNDTEAETEESPESTSSPDESETEEEEEAVTPSKTSEKDSTKSETTTSETTTEAVTVQSVSAVVSGTHYVGETLTGADFTVTVTYSDGETLTNPAGWSAQPLTLNSTSNLITVAYEGASVTITVNAETVLETTTAATVAATTQATTAATTAATTQATTVATTAATTTAAETTTAENDDSVHFICADCDWSYEYAMALFDAQNDLRAELGLPDFIWDDEMYEVAKQCAKACGDAGEIDHALTAPYRHRTVVYDSYGNTVDCLYVENLSTGGCPTNYSDLAWEAANILDGIKNSSGHYAQIKAASNIYTAIAAYRKNDRIYISYLFLGDDKVDWWIDY